MLTETWTDGLADADPDPNWIWPGLLAPEQITLLTAVWKTGKTTLLALLLARRHSAGTLLNRPVRPGVTAIVTEESRALWRGRDCKLTFGPNVCFFCRPFASRPTRSQFDDLVAHLLDLRRRRGLDLVAIDTLARFLPLRTENSAEAMLEALAPLRRLTDEGLALLLCHHPAKGRAAPGQAARGSGALPAFADILLEMRPADPDSPADRRRLLFGYGRSDETPPLVQVELNADGSDYAVLSEAPADDFARQWPALFGVLEEAREKLTRTRILEHWPDDYPRPSLATLWRWLDTACARRLVCCEGTGRAADPFRYWLAAREQEWLQDPLYCLLHGLPIPPVPGAPPAGAPGAPRKGVR
jgi:hypothetical protein